MERERNFCKFQLLIYVSRLWVEWSRRMWQRKEMEGGKSEVRKFYLIFFFFFGRGREITSSCCVNIGSFIIIIHASYLLGGEGYIPFIHQCRRRLMVLLELCRSSRTLDISFRKLPILFHSFFCFETSGWPIFVLDAANLNVSVEKGQRPRVSSDVRRIFGRVAMTTMFVRL